MGPQSHAASNSLTSISSTPDSARSKIWRPGHFVQTRILSHGRNAVAKYCAKKTHSREESLLGGELGALLQVQERRTVTSGQ